ncbi:MAG TPA: hypothetical protein VIM73_13805, partial [Polyangiaceae bacterium]
VETLRRAAGQSPIARTEAEAITDAGTVWPALELAPPSIGAGTLADPSLYGVSGNSVQHGIGDILDSDKSPLSERGTPVAAPDGSATVTLASGIHSGFTEVEPGEAFLDLPIEFEELEQPASVEPLRVSDYAHERDEHYDAIAPEDLGSEWLARATETPTELVLDPLEYAVSPDSTALERLERMDTLEDITDAPTDPMAAIRDTRTPADPRATGPMPMKRAGSRES